MKFPIAFLVLLLASFSSQAFASDTVHHTLKVSLDPETHMLVARDELRIPKSLVRAGLVLLVNDALDVTLIDGNASLERVTKGQTARDVGMDRDNDGPGSTIQVAHYRLKDVDPDGDIILNLEIRGVINNPFQMLNEEYSRGFSRSAGLIEERGAYLSGATYWVPTIADALVTYDMTVSMPQHWRSVSQGRRDLSLTAERHMDQWVVETPTEEIYLIAAVFTEYEMPAGNVKTMAFLRERDDALANKYLTTTAQYLEMYRQLIGPYPYSKFALVENFWETGYGMPSFTLLGSQIIRFPFILHSSYPHELLHNWWGNGVFIDFESGNWAEGLTVYMADHLVAEQRGQGAEYRRSTLQGYTNYVDPSDDFSLRKFRSRYNAVTSNVGYGKTNMVFNMLRRKVGDEAFKRSLQHFYRAHSFSTGSWDDIRESFEEVTGEDLGSFFSQWVDGVGALSLRLASAHYERNKLVLTIEQLQPGAPYIVDVPVAIYTADKVTRHTVTMTKARESAAFEIAEDVVKVEVDPEFDLFRRLHWSEVPPSFGQAFGAEDVVLVVPSEGDVSRYEQLADIWAQSGRMTVVRDSDLTDLPDADGVWILGETNRFRDVIAKGLEGYPASAGASAATFGDTDFDYSNNSTVIAVRHPANPKSVVVGLTAHSEDAVAGLARKLPHYGKYSYLSFTNTAPDNNAKGQWPAVGSPLVKVLNEAMPSTATLKPHPALAMLKPVFDNTRMMGHVENLTAPDMEGRGVGTAGLDKAGAYIAKAFEDAGLKPGGDEGWFQPFTMKGPQDRDTTVRNVVGVIEGTNPDYAGQSVVLSAHYDHLGYGWPGGRVEFAGQRHDGADDNASGVAVLLELAATLAASAPERSIVFLATTAEESGLKGARHYVKSAKRYPADKVMGDVNLDSVGRMDGKILVFGGNSAREWRFIFMGTTATTGIPTELVLQDVNASDHTAFAEVGIPAVHLFGSAHEDYHRPTDTADKVRVDSLVKVASVTKEVVEYLAGRPEPLTANAAGSASHERPAASNSGGRTVSTGILPDFTFAGPGIKISSVSKGSAADAAGLKAGDIVTHFDGKEIEGLRDYSAMLTEHKPGDDVELTVKRGDERLTVRLTLQAR